MSVLPTNPVAEPLEVPFGPEHLAPVIPLVPPHDHTWALRDTEYGDNGLTLNRFECDGCSAVRFT